MNTIVKKNARRNKRAFADQLAKEAEEAGNKRDIGALHRITEDCADHVKNARQPSRIVRGSYILRYESRRQGESNTSKIL